MNKAASLYLDVLRLAAALVVFIVHASYLLPGGMPALWFVSGLGGEAVTVFFVLSGFVIAHVVRTREFRAADYLASRFARLYSVVLPALLVTVVLDCAGAALAPGEYAASMEHGAWGIGASLLFANELWFAAIRPLSNTPFWSLGYEFWYYMIYAAARYVPGRRSKCIAVLVLCMICGPKILLLMPVWLFGVAAYAVTCRRRLGQPAALVLAAATTGGLYLLATSGAKAAWRELTIAALGPVAPALGPSSHVLYSCAFGLLATLHVVGMMALAPVLGRVWHACEHPVRIMSAYTFAIYLFHYPILKFFAVAIAPAGLGMLQVPVVVVATLGMIAALGSLSDRFKPVLKRSFGRGLEGLARACMRRGSDAGDAIEHGKHVTIRGGR
ncbi:acyltransferase family protein [Massilia dura]|uniref:Acyltransferase family protein n=1 Tax=Pseudoduganella dura TaxID=321982 RepID=A0A6I3XVH3_9BURK|nr:acyltransferase [Pseudoduganella dura]MUI15725.1 acyltransferase family protein [Pseudoduganella dura]GGX88921.1 acyltransferase [Pseudoduganella dura]